MEPQTLFLKIIVIGDSGVGKTSLIHQYCYGFFKSHCIATIGCDFSTKVLTKFQQKTVRIQLWDIAGQEKYKMFSKLYLRGATGCIIVSDINKLETLDSALKWKNIVNDCFKEEHQQQIPIILFQNKVDLLDIALKDDAQKTNVLQEFDSDPNFIGCVETSAKENTNIKEGILRLVEEIMKRRSDDDLKENDDVWDKRKEKKDDVLVYKKANNNFNDPDVCFKCIV